MKPRLLAQKFECFGHGKIIPPLVSSFQFMMGYFSCFVGKVYWLTFAFSKVGGRLIEERSEKGLAVRKRRFLTVLFSLIFCLLQILFIIPTGSAAAQDQEDPDFIVTLALMAVADDRMDGVMDTSALSNLRAVVDEYYTQQGYKQMDAAMASALSDQRQLILTALDKKIINQQALVYKAQVGLFVGMVDSIDERYQNDPDTWGNPYDIFRAALSSGYEPDPRLKDMLQQRLAQGTQSAVQASLDGNVAAGIPGGDQVVAQNSDTIYDFSAGLSSEIKEPQEIVHKPLIFTNIGSKEVRVTIEYYEPPVGLAASAPGMNVQVSGNTSVILDGFPQGNYVFCVDWQTNLDTDSDGIKDYDRAVIQGWVSSAQTDDIRLAREVYVNANFSPTPSGQCDGFKGEAPSTETVMTEVMLGESDHNHWEAAVIVEEGESQAGVDSQGEDQQENNQNGDEDQPSSGADFWDQGDGSDEEGDDPPSSGSAPDESSPGGVLTAAETSNQGTHNYTMTCVNEGLTDTRSFSATWEFTADGVLLNGENFYSRVSENVYQNEYGTIITFFGGGYLADSFYTETSSEGQTTTSETNCTANFQ